MEGAQSTRSKFCGFETVHCFANSTPAPPTPPPQWGLLALTVVPVWIVVGNGLVLLALLLQRHLQNMSNRVIASLAVTDFTVLLGTGAFCAGNVRIERAHAATDFLLALVVVPLSIYQLVRSFTPIPRRSSLPRTVRFAELAYGVVLYTLSSIFYV